MCLSVCWGGSIWSGTLSTKIKQFINILSYMGDRFLTQKNVKLCRISLAAVCLFREIWPEIVRVVESGLGLMVVSLLPHCSPPADGANCQAGCDKIMSPSATG